MSELPMEIKTYRICNWDKWQSYRKDRGQPPWIKLHRNLMNNWEFASLNDAERGQLIMLWLLASDKNGLIPANPSLLKQLCNLSEEPNLQLFENLGFIELGCHVDANVTPTRRQSDALEAEEDTEAEYKKLIEANNKLITGKGEKSKKDEVPLKDYPPELNVDAWEEYLQYRKEARIRKLTPQGEQKQIEKLIGFGDKRNQQSAIDETIRNGWQGIFEPKATGPPSRADKHLEAIRNL